MLGSYTKMLTFTAKYHLLYARGQEVVFVNEIPQNIAILLKRKKQEERRSLTEISEEFDIPRSTLQNLMRGEKPLRTDTVELIAEKLNVPLGELISGEPIGCRMTARAAMNILLREVRTIPEPFRSAATAMLHSLEEAFRLNEIASLKDDLYFLNCCNPNDVYRYYVHESRIGPRYGIVVKQNTNGWTTVALAPGLSDDLGFVLALARDFTKAQLPPEK